MRTIGQPSGPRRATPGSYALEILLGLALLSALNFYFFPDRPGFAGISPHPYWVVVLPVAARYGFFGGVWSGAAAGALYFILRAMAIPDVSLLDISVFEFWGLPLFFLVGGVVLGEIRQVQIRRQLEMVVERDDAKHALDRLENQYRTLAEAKERGLAFLDKLVLEGKDSASGPLKSNVGFLREKTANLLEF